MAALYPRHYMSWKKREWSQWHFNSTPDWWRPRVLIHRCVVQPVDHPTERRKTMSLSFPLCSRRCHRAKHTIYILFIYLFFINWQLRGWQSEKVNRPPSFLWLFFWPSNKVTVISGRRPSLVPFSMINKELGNWGARGSRPWACRNKYVRLNMANWLMMAIHFKSQPTNDTIYLHRTKCSKPAPLFNIVIIKMCVVFSGTWWIAMRTKKSTYRLLVQVNTPLSKLKQNKKSDSLCHKAVFKSSVNMCTAHVDLDLEK